MNVDPQVETMTAEQAGVSQAALDAARAIFRLDGLRAYRRDLIAGSAECEAYDQRANLADWARIINAELKRIPTPRVIITVEGGLVQDIHSSVPLSVSVLDLDICDEDEESDCDELRAELDQRIFAHVY
jgi:hypothetical protein